MSKCQTRPQCCSLGAYIEVDLEGDGAFLLEVFGVFGVEVGSAVEADEFAPEHFDIGIVGDHGPIAVDFNGVHHGVTTFVP